MTLIGYLLIGLGLVCLFGGIVACGIYVERYIERMERIEGRLPPEGDRQKIERRDN